MNHKKEYTQYFENLKELISHKRQRESSNQSNNQSIMQAIESDKGRIINSSAFRRLQQKAQVFSLESNAAVRSRLTHSFEVAQVGRFIVQSILSLFSNKGVHISYQDAFAFTTLVENACLLHDIGNPAFGHLGESAIQKWFEMTDIKGDESSSLVELEKFDGNAQGLRLVCFLSGNDEYGLNLTYSTLLSMIKYPQKISSSNNKKGIYDKDYQFLYSKACKELGWEEGKVFPFALIMNIADDIAYSMSDIEDGIEKNILSVRDIQYLVKIINNECGNGNSTEEIIKITKDDWNDNKLVYIFTQKIKTFIINKCVNEVSKIFIENTNKILKGGFNFDESLKENQYLKMLDIVKKFSRQKIYSHRSVERIELAGDKILKGLLDIYKPILRLKEEDFNVLVLYLTEYDNFEKIKEKNLHYESRLLNTIPKNYIIRYKKALNYFNNERGEQEERIGIDEINLRSHMIVDYLSGMTDDFALEQYNLLSGHLI